MFLTTEEVVADKPEPAGQGGMLDMSGMGGMGGMM
jgi:chaperonin GroEL